MTYDTRLSRTARQLPQIPRDVDPSEALRALRSCIDDRGVMVVDPSKAQFRDVTSNERAITILHAVDIALRIKA